MRYANRKICLDPVKEAPISSVNKVKHEAHGTQQPRPINKIDEEREYHATK